MDDRTRALLKSEDLGDRIEALRELALLEDEDAGPAAIELLRKDRSPEVREHALRTAGLALGGAAVGDLEAAVESDGDAIVRRTALAILGEIGERPAQAALARLVARLEGQDRLAALDALRSNGEPSGFAAAAALVDDPDEKIAASALHAAAVLCPSSDARARLAPAATRLLSREGPLHVVAAAAWVLGHEPAAAIARLATTARRQDRERAAIRAADLPREVALPTLRALVAVAEPGREILAARELARLGEVDGAAVLAKTAYEAAGRLAIEAAVGLAELGCCAGEPVLVRALARAPAADRPLIARGLALCGDPAGSKVLGALLSSDLPSDRRAAAVAFARLGRREGTPELVRTLDFVFRRERAEAHSLLAPLIGEGAPAFDPFATRAERATVVAAFRKKLAPDA